MFQEARHIFICLICTGLGHEHLLVQLCQGHATCGDQGESYVWTQVSFLGRVSSSALGDGTKLISQLGTTRSFVFGKENSQLGNSRDVDASQVGRLRLFLFARGARSHACFNTNAPL